MPFTHTTYGYGNVIFKEFTESNTYCVLHFYDYVVYLISF